MTLAARETQLQAWLQSLPHYEPEQFHMISGDASFRRYFRFSHQGKSYIAVDAPPATEKNQEFVALSSAYKAVGVNVPEVLDADLVQGFMVLADFGDQLFSLQIQQGDAVLWYQRALDELPKIQQVKQIHNNEGLIELPAFDRDFLVTEYALFNDWLLKQYLDLSLTAAQWQVIHDCQTFLTQVFVAQPQAGVHRDYHSRNLMICGDKEAESAIGVIDFQDAMIGPITYDAVSLLRDCYVVWPNEFVQQQLQRLHQQNYAQHSWQDFRFWFDCVGMQRHIKASGIFSRLCLRDGKSGYLNDIPRTLQYLITVGSTIPECQAFVELVAEIVLPAMENKLTGNAAQAPA